jgi:anti-sigma factor RsiW
MNNALRQLFDPVADEPVPARLALHTPDVRKRRSWRAAAAAAWIAVGATMGWMLHPAAVVHIADGPMRQDLVRPAAFAHAVYATDVRHPVEVAAEHEQHLVSWLSDRLHTDIRAPSLAGQGYRLIGGRLLPSTNRMAAQFMYEREDGVRVTLYVRRGAWANTATSFRFGNEDGLGVFYWIDGPLGYALTGELNRTELLALSEAVHEQLH